MVFHQQLREFLKDHPDLTVLTETDLEKFEKTCSSEPWHVGRPGAPIPPKGGPGMERFREENRKVNESHVESDG